MKIVAISDIHQMISKWEEAVKLCQKQKFDVVILNGDIFPKDKGITSQLSFITRFNKYAQQIKDTGTQFLFLLGNDDNQLLIPEMEKGHKKSLWYYMAGEVVKIKGYEFAGMPYVPDYPFGYKFWCRGEFKDSLRINPSQYGKPLLINASNQFEPIKDYFKYMEEQESIWESLVKVAAKVKHMGRSIWLIHAPPSDLFLDVCSHGARVGSKAVYKFIQEYQPLLTIHGHIHESPEYNGHKWCQQEGKTLCVQGGQVGFDLHYSIFDIKNGVIKYKKHSIYK